jgi:type I restriction enzyme S subunit
MANVKKGHKKTELCEIPEEWEVIKLDKIFDFYGGQPIPRRQLNDDGIDYLHYGDIHTLNRNYIDIKHDTNWLPKINTEIKINKDSLLNEGDIVFVDASEDYEGIGKSVVIYNQGKIPFVAGLHTIIAKEKSKTLSNNFKRYCFSTRAVRQQFRMLATGATV